jgi:hypothetical protein
MRARIFVMIASYMDEELVPTVRSAIDRAANPDHLSFGIVDQAITDHHAALTALTGQMAYMRVHPRDSLGCCWARSISQTLYDGEDIALQIDSHMRFDPGWDARMLAELATAQALAGHSRVLLTTYPSAYRYDAHGGVFEQPHRSWKIAIEQEGPWDPETQPPPRGQSVTADEESATPGRLLAAGFLAGAGSWIEELPYDPRLYFDGEELALALRAFTSGWDVFHPAIAPLRHLYKRKQPEQWETAIRHWDETFDTDRRFKAAQLESRARARFTDLVAGRVRGMYGLGSARAAGDFWPEAGIALA